MHTLDNLAGSLFLTIFFVTRLVITFELMHTLEGIPLGPHGQDQRRLDILDLLYIFFRVYLHRNPQQ